MDIAFIQEVSSLMQAVTNLTGLPVSWKRANGFWFDNRIPYHQCLRYNSFCTGVKSKKRTEEKCLHNTGLLIEERSNARKGNFINRCHAGIHELIIPLFKGDLYDGYLSVGPFRMPETRTKFHQLEKEFLDLPVYDQEKCGAAEKLLGVLGKYIIERKELTILRQLTAEVKEPRIAKALEYVKANYMKVLTIEKLAEICCLSPSRFIHLFKEQTGMTFSQCLIQCKIEEAKKQLAGSNMDIYHVGYNSGFKSQSYFGLIFRKCTGMTPTGYRKKCLKEFASGAKNIQI
ncbi:MAG: hypothetical protein A2X48_00540 [Lentisphaerae bacterium GWF2_49_21]|nr:MAG: hypothetical protein A2X48_00540 [Lentisphaerae bacterium GWF2_49_21]